MKCTHSFFFFFWTAGINLIRTRALNGVCGNLWERTFLLFFGTRGMALSVVFFYYLARKTWAFLWIDRTVVVGIRILFFGVDIWMDYTIIPGSFE